MNQINPKDLKIVKGLPPVSKKGDKISLDTEWFNRVRYVPSGGVADSLVHYRLFTVVRRSNRYLWLEPLRTQ